MVITMGTIEAPIPRSVPTKVPISPPMHCITQTTCIRCIPKEMTSGSEE